MGLLTNFFTHNNNNFLMPNNNTEIKLGKLSKTRKTDFLIKTKLEKQDEEVVGCVNFTIFKFDVNYFVT